MTLFTAAHTPALTTRIAKPGLRRLFAVWAQRQTLRSLDAEALADIGRTRAEADAESGRSFWDAPESWRR